MLVTVIAILCRLGPAGASDCREETVTNSEMTAGLTFMNCAISGQAPIAQWKAQHPIYGREAWSVERYSCVLGAIRHHA